MAAMYREGKGTIIHHRKCYQLTKVAIDRKIPRAFTQMGLIHEDHISFDSTLEKALSFYIQGGHLGDADGYHNAGVLYAKNEAYLDYCSALRYFQLSDGISSSSYKKKVIQWCANLVIKEYSSESLL
eukprot:CAMPEP_0117422312 /NCGR_PEP_ID=MMETSP0758-20121206/3181_1 /TAXON_ID=63605 /ORGANISM="Percolomonas cosmopolitus, Strain AE-1 (ATCC 50343)" /LENGTH=126 /DNA_ID=CAMNT_0005204865 /DNA_START=219 /DNA_END=599 /DNA_ORIENTATION=-